MIISVCLFLVCINAASDASASAKSPPPLRHLRRFYTTPISGDLNVKNLHRLVSQFQATRNTVSSSDPLPPELVPTKPTGNPPSFQRSFSRPDNPTKHKKHTFHHEHINVGRWLLLAEKTLGECENFEVAEAVARFALQGWMSKAIAAGNQQQAASVLDQPTVLGRGSFGTVLGSSNQWECFKCYRYLRAYHEERQSFEKLRDAFDEGWPRNLVWLKEPEAFLKPRQLGDETFVAFMPMERFHHDLGKFPMKACEFTASQVLKEIGSALYALHSKGLVHADVKLENVLCWNPRRGDRISQMKLGDLGGITEYRTRDFLTFRGTVSCVSPSMMTTLARDRRNQFPEAAPERMSELKFHRRMKDKVVADAVFALFHADVTARHGTYLQKEDIWQLGIMLLEILNVEFRRFNHPKLGWWDSSEEFLDEPIVKGIGGVIRQRQDLLSKMLSMSPQDRLSFAGLKEYIDKETANENS